MFHIMLARPYLYIDYTRHYSNKEDMNRLIAEEKRRTALVYDDTDLSFDVTNAFQLEKAYNSNLKEYFSGSSSDDTLYLTRQKFDTRIFKSNSLIVDFTNRDVEVNILFANMLFNITKKSLYFCINDCPAFSMNRYPLSLPIMVGKNGNSIYMECGGTFEIDLSTLRVYRHFNGYRYTRKSLGYSNKIRKYCTTIEPIFVDKDIYLRQSFLGTQVEAKFIDGNEEEYAKSNAKYFRKLYGGSN